MPIGRDRELEILARFTGSDEPRPTALVLEGETGVGRTTLLLAACDAARRRGQRVLSSRPGPSDAAVGFIGLADLLESVTDAVAELPEPQRAALEIAVLHRAGSTDRRRVTLAMRGLLRTLADEGPVVIAVDDGAWLDPSSAGVLADAIGHAERSQIRLLVTGERDGAVALPLDRMTAGRVTVLAVAPMTEQALFEVVAEHVGSGFSPTERSTLAELSNGNPHLAIQMARAKLRGDAAPTGFAIPVPRDLRTAVIRERVGEVDETTWDLLVLIATASRPSPDLLARVIPGSYDAASTNLLDAGVIGIDDGVVTFRDPVLRGAVYADAPRSTRHAAHRRLADATGDPELRAHHLARGTDTPDPTVARVLEDAAGHASARGATDAAADLATAAARLTPEHDAAARARRLVLAATWWVASEDPAAAATAATAAVETGDHAAALDAAVLLADLALARGDATDAVDALAGVADEPAISDEIQADLAEASAAGGDLDAARARADRISDPTSPHALRARAAVLLASGDADAASTVLARIVDEPAEPLRTQARALLTLGRARRASGDRRGARIALEAAVSAFERSGHAHWLPTVHAEIARLPGRRGVGRRLSPAEEQVALLAASGLRNREIAQTLTLSVRTVESHLSNVYAKLGVRSRTELALFLDPELAQPSDP
jgi:DNA-binding CsgD family transcriptional regulator